MRDKRTPTDVCGEAKDSHHYLTLINKSFVLSQFKASLFNFSPNGMIQCDMQLNKNIYFYANQTVKTKRDLQAGILYSVECGVNVEVSGVWLACVDSGADVIIARLSKAGEG